MKKIYARDNNSILKLSIIFIISLLPLISYGFYKNGIHLYLKGYITFLEMFKPLLFVVTGSLIGAIVNLIYEKVQNKKNDNIKEILFSSFHILYGLLIACLISINTNYFIFLIITFIILYLSKLFKIKSINLIALSTLIIILLSYLISDFTYLNEYELNTILNLNATDYLMGRGSGGIATTCIALIALSLIILWNAKGYKKEITISSIVSFSTLITIYCVYQSNIANVFDMLFTNGIMFSLVFVAPELISSSYTKYGKIIYGIITGILTFILYLINPTFAALGAILISSILSSIFDVKFE